MAVKPKDLTTILNMIERGELSSQDGYQLIEKLEQIEPEKNNFKSVVLTKPSHVQDLALHPFSLSEPGEGEVQILVKAFSLNFGDLLCVKGLYPTIPSYPFTPGFEVSGVVMRTGPNVTSVKPGDEVIGLMGESMGGQSSIATTNEQLVVKKPPHISHEEACAFPIVFTTMYHVFDVAKVKKRDKILIQTAAGGVGLIAVQLANMIGAECIVTAGSKKKLDFLQQNFGAQHLINYQEEDFATRVLELTDNQGVDVVINTLSGDSIQKGINILAPGGRYMEIAMTGLQSSEKFDLSNLVHNQTFHSVDLRRLVTKQPEIIDKYLQVMSQVLAAGSVKPTVGKVFPMEQIMEAYQWLEKRENIGKVVVTPESGNLAKELIKDYKPEHISLDNITNRTNSTTPLFPKEEEDIFLNSRKENKQTNDIAIVGISCRFPDADNTESFWSNIANKKSAIREVPSDRWSAKQYYDPNPEKLNKTNSKWGGFLNHIDRFDAFFFNMSGKEASLTDPQQRIFLEESWLALEDAGFSNEMLSNMKCAVFAGVGSSDYMMNLNDDIEPQSLWGTESSILPARISYFLNLKGPSVTVNTACSSSLVSIHLGCQSILSGDSEIALAGGVFVSNTPYFHIAASNAGMLSSDGKCKTFDQKANGFVPGEGAGVVVLKSLEQAKRDGDRIYGVIKATGINQDGKTNGITAPSTLSQTDLELAVYRKANINPEDIRYVEAHGTGTKLGDPIEIEALTNAFQKYTDKKQFCGIGSVKTNIGHTSAAAGVSSVIKVLMALKYKQLPPSLNCEDINEYIDFENSPFYVNRELRDWNKEQDKPRISAISSFGFSGTNAHLVVEEYNETEMLAQNSEKQYPAYFIPISAKTEYSMNKRVQDLLTWIGEKEVEGQNFRMADLSYTLGRRRSHFPIRAAWVVRDLSELKSKLVNFDYESDAIKTKTIHNKDRYNQKALMEQIACIDSNEDKYIDQLLELASIYQKGYEIDWKVLFTGDKFQYVPLPSYPFDRQRYWYTEHNTELSISTSFLHPLIEANTSSLTEQRFSTTFTGEEFFLKDHQIAGKAILPATAYIEMARAAGELSSNGKISGLSNLTWLQPYEYSNDKAKNQLHIGLYPIQDNEVDFEIYSGKEDAATIHVQGTLHYEIEPTSKDNQEEYLPILDIQKRLNQRPTRQELYEWFAKHELMYGESFKTITEISIGEDGAIARLKNSHPDAFNQDAGTVHPSLLDGALQTLMATAYGQPKEERKTYLPFALEQVEFHSPLTNDCYAYVKKAKTDSEHYSIVLMDTSGKILVRLSNLMVREYVNQSDKENINTLLYKPTWNLQELMMDSNTNVVGDVLIFDTDDTMYREWTKNKEKTANQVIFIKPGIDFKTVDENEYIINPADNDHYKQLLFLLKSKQIKPTNILFNWSHVENANRDQRLEWLLEKGIFPLFHLTQNLMHVYKDNESIYLLYSHPNQDKLDATFRAVSSWLQTLVQEKPAFQYKSILLENKILSTEEWIQELVDLQKQQHKLRQSVQIYYSERSRWVCQLAPQVVPVHSKNNNSTSSQIRHQGTYIITGGLGGLGMSLANYLAIKYEARLVLSGRSQITNEQRKRFEEWKLNGAQVYYYQGDISKKEDVQDLITFTKERFGQIKGIIHTAGVLRDGLIYHKTVEDMKDVFAAKVYGTVWLDEATRSESLDFFVLYSSLASILGNVGQSDYAYANGFLDAYAECNEEWRKKGQNRTRIISLNWPSWQIDGMQLDPKMKNLMKEEGLYPLTEEAGLEAFEMALSTEEGGQWLVLYGNPTKLDRLIDANSKTSVTMEAISTEQKEVEGNMIYYEKKMQNYLIDLLAKETQISRTKIDVEEPLETYGIDSAMIVNLTRNLEDDFGTLTKTLFFEYQTIEQLVHYFVAQFPKQISSLFGSSELVTDTNQYKNKQENVINREEYKHTKRKKSRFVSKKTNGTEDDPIAIIGVSGRYPQANNLNDFWENLKNGKDCITEIPQDRRNNPNRQDQSKWGGFLKDVDKFDPLFFNISPREAELMDPQERMFLENVWHTLEDAGYTHTELKQSRTAVFVGVMYGQYQLYGTQNAWKGEGFVPSSSYASIANRVSYFMDWHGPSMAIDTMCSSSLTALHLACKSIRDGEADTAIAGGVNVSIHPYKYHLLSQSNFTSSDGRCRSFGEGGDGYVPSEGVGSVLLKPLSKAIADGDQIYAIIRGTALNHGGKTNGYTVPSPNAQTNVIESALKATNIHVEDISYIEAHGTGTALGDPIEITGLTKAFEKNTNIKQYCAIGSVKSNIGHAESAAGIAAISKVLLQMKYRKLVPSLHVDTLNTNIDFEATPFFVQRQLSDWNPPVQKDGKKKTRIAAVSSFGAGGSNAHIILEEYDNETEEVRPVENSRKQIFVLSAKYPEGLQIIAKELYKYIENASQVDFDRIAYTIQTGREAMEERLAIVASSLMELKEKLSTYLAADTNTDGIYQGKYQRDSVFEILGGGKTAKELVKVMLAEKESEEIAKLWSNGMDIDWKLLYDSSLPKRISLPLYPFKRERYWLDTVEEMASKSVENISEVRLESHTDKRETPSVASFIDSDLLRLIMEDLQQAAAYLIKLEPNHLDIEENLGNYGFDSVTLKELSDELSSLYQIEVLPTVFFEQSHIAGIAKYLFAEFPEEIRKFYQRNQTIVSNKQKTLEIDTLSNQPVSNPLHSTYRNEPIAIIGMSGKFPQSNDLDEYWDNLVNEKDMITKVPKDRWNWEEFADKNSKLYSPSSWGGFIEDVDTFDPRFFSISPFEAEMMDPQQRLALETVWKTIEDAGYKASDYAGRNVGLFIGAQFQDYLQLLHDDGQFNAQMGTGNELSILVNRISYLLDFHGPSEPYNTACSSSSVAIHRAVQSIRNGESEVAIAGGISLILAPYGMISAGQMGILSPDGRCKTLSSGTNGYVKGEGVGMLMLKPLSKAISDNDHIYSVIRGTAVNHGGKANSLTAPNSDAQANLLIQAYKEAGFDPETVSYLELHGTGTELGDPVEIEGIKKAFKKLAHKQGKPFSKQAYCGIGSVKTNIGHLEPASGIAGIMKVILAMRYKKLPGILHLEKVNPYVKLEDTPFYITDKTRDWKRFIDDQGQEILLRAGVSSFGFGGVNAHIVLEEYMEASSEVPAESDNQLFVFSAKNNDRLKEYIEQFIEFVEKESRSGQVASIAKQQLELDIITIISDMIEVSPQEIDETEHIEEYGIEPVHLNHLIEKLQTKYVFDNLPVLQQVSNYQSIQELTSYFHSILSNQTESDVMDANQFIRWAYTLQVGREEMDTRIACVAVSPAELVMKFRQFLDGNMDVGGLYYRERVFKNKLDVLYKEENDSINQLLDDKALHQIARRWVDGEVVDWKRLYPNQSIKRIPLPTYPFAKERYWAPKTSPTMSDKLIEQAVTMRSKSEIAAIQETEEKIDHESIVQVLKEILAEKLKLDQEELDPNVELSVYGVDSMLSSIIMQVVEERFGEQMDANIIVEYPTIAALSDYILIEIKPKEITPFSQKQRTSKPKYPPELIPINTKGTKQLSFWFHGATGYSTVFRNLSRLLGPDYPIYAFQARGTDGKTMPHMFEEMVDHYYNCVRMIQPTGPYFFGGYSFGGLVAMEIAKRLKAEGEEILHLIMFDTYPPTDDVNRLFYDTYDFDFLKLFLVNAFLKSDENPELLITNKDINGIPKRLQISHLAKLAKEKSGTLIENDEIYNFIRGGMLVSDYAEEAYAAHRPGPYEVSDVTFFKTTKGFVSEDNPFGLPGVRIIDSYDYSTYWEEMVNKDLVVHTVECDHNSILEEPTLSEVVPIVSKLLNIATDGTEEDPNSSSIQEVLLLLQTFRNLGIFQRAGESYQDKELFDKLGLTSVYSSLFQSWIKLLEEKGYILKENGKIITTNLVEIDE